ncbi:MAG TPA: ribosome-associated translation inhibitor RaiA [Candidatus Dormibacteraeota bacterium]|nr:ribosome-associated translation inhibitor RaiA [Candidatus Dormibacteraeota bacterium]
MKVVLHDRTGALGPELREYAERKLARLERHFGKLADAEVDFSEERKRSGAATSVCRIKVHFNGRRSKTLNAHESGADAQAALDLAIDKIDRQVVKTKEMRSHRKQPVSAIRVPPEEPAPPRSAEPERIRMKLHAETEEEAVKELMADGQAFHVFLEEVSGQIEIVFAREDGSLAILEPIVP